MGLVDDIKMQFKRPNNLVLQIIVVNIAIWLPFTLLTVLSELFGFASYFDFFFSHIALPSSLQEFIFKPWTLLTYGFLHSVSSIFHIIMNMYILYLFGRLIADAHGDNKVLSIYILGILAGGAFYLLAYNFIPYYIERGSSHLIGASAGVTAIVVAAATFMPDYKFNMIFIGPVKIVYIAAFMVFVSYMGATGRNAGGEISHLGGALIGYLYVRAYQKGTDIGKWVLIVFELFKSIFKPKPKIKVSYTNPRKKTTTTKRTDKTGNFTSQAEIDAILDKISQSGYESLSKEEKQKLFSASRKN